MTRLGTMAMSAVVVMGAGAAGCRKSTLDDQEQIGASAGEVMASLDESADGRVTAALNEPAGAPSPGVPVFRTPAELRGPLWRRALDALEPSAYAGTCLSTTFSTCDAGVRTRTFSSCTIGPSTLDGSVTLTFNRAQTCVVAAAGDSVTRTADFTLTGPWGGTLDVTSPGGGQTLAKTADGFSYSVGGMERVLKGPAGRTLFDISTQTTAPLVITGTSRADLTIVSGTLEITHRLAGYKVDLTADHLAWSATCNCAVSGTLTGTVSGGAKDGKAASVTLKGCGQAEVTIDGDMESVTLDRCAGI